MNDLLRALESIGKLELIAVADLAILLGSLLLKPVPILKVYAACAGVIIASALFTVPVKLSDKSAFNGVDCGSVLNPKTISGPVDSTDTSYVAPLTINGVCQTERWEALAVALLVGLVSLAFLIENVRAARAGKSAAGS